MTVPQFNCICDSNIWINVCLGEIHETYIKKYSTIGVVDVVKNEILKWERNEGRFKEIFNLFLQYENQGLTIINNSSVDLITQKIISQELIRFGYTDIDNRDKTIEDLGEFVSLLYAYHLEVPYIHTEDMNFHEDVQMNELYSQYKGIEMMTWNQVSRNITNSDSERLALNQRVTKENEVMGIQRKKTKEKQEMKEKLNALQKKYSKR